MAMVAQAYMDGWFGAVPVDPCKAIDYAIKANLVYPNLGNDIIVHGYARGLGLPKDIDRAILWYLTAVDERGILSLTPELSKLMREALDQGRWESIATRKERWNRYRETEEVKKNACKKETAN